MGQVELRRRVAQSAQFGFEFPYAGFGGIGADPLSVGADPLSIGAGLLIFNGGDPPARLRVAKPQLHPFTPQVQAQRRAIAPQIPAGQLGNV